MPGSNQKDFLLKMIGTAIISSPRLLFSFGGSYLRFRGQAKKAGRRFEDTLLHYGVDEHSARLLTEQYVKASDIKSYLGIGFGRN